MGAMQLSTLTADLKASLGDASARWRTPVDADFVRLLRLAAVEMQAKRPVTKPGSVQLMPEQARYLVDAADFAALKTHSWADPALTPKPWAPDYPGSVPRVCAQWDAGWWLEFSPAPTMRQICVWGSEFKFWYFGTHVLSDVAGETTLAEADRGLLLLRAQAEAMRELAMSNVVKPQQMRDGYSGAPRNGTPAALFEALQREFREAR